MGEPVAGKFLLEILTKGMYSNPMHVYREYIQNCTDAIDQAVAAGLITHAEGEIRIQIDPLKRTITIRDNGSGIPSAYTREILLSIGDSAKDGINERGFRGIGRLAGLAYADEVRFVTSAANEPVKTIMVCDCSKMQQLLQKTNRETTDVMETFMAISRFLEPRKENVADHYFEVQLIGVPEDSGLLEENAVWKYLEETAPVDFNSQQFSQADKIREEFAKKNCPITCYRIFRGSRKLPIYKPYSRSLSTGKQAKTKNKDFVRDIEFVYEVASDGQPLYMGWLAITDFSGVISEQSLQGIRFRKGNILVGNHTTFVKFFPSEGHNANRMFAGEIHALHDELVPNSQRDDFEPNAIYTEMKLALSKWAGEINRKYRRGTSEATAALRRLNQLNAEQKELEDRINSGAITSDEKREQIADKLKEISKKREKDQKVVQKAFDRGTFDADRKEAVERTLAQTETAAKKATTLDKKIVNAEYATKYDLPSSYGRQERKMYQRIITVIDTFFSGDPDTAEKLRAAIIKELSVKKK